MKDALHTPTKGSATAGPAPALLEGSLQSRSVFGTASFDIRSFELVRRFVEHVVAKNASVAPVVGQEAIDWVAVQTAVTNSGTLEQAIGRAVVIADQMSRGLFDIAQPHDSQTSRKAEDPLFAEDPFSMADVVPDFGDGSRYRTRAARRVTRLFGIQRTAMPAAAPSSSSAI
jgi:hypothetical protein